VSVNDDVPWTPGDDECSLSFHRITGGRTGTSGGRKEKESAWSRQMIANESHRTRDFIIFKEAEP
jgi:hypothetical protein